MDFTIDNNSDHEIEVNDINVKTIKDINFVKDDKRSSPKKNLDATDIGIELLMNNKKKDSSRNSGRNSSHSNRSSISIHSSGNQDNRGNDIRSYMNMNSNSNSNSGNGFSSSPRERGGFDTYDTVSLSEKSYDGKETDYDRVSYDNDDNVSMSSDGSRGDRDHYDDEEALSYKETQRKKRIYLYKLRKLKTKYGCQLSREYTMEDDLRDMIDEYRDASVAQRYEKSIRSSRRMLINFVSGVEYLNKRFDPIGARLDGWSEQTMDDIEDYDEVFEDLEEKYGESFEKISPEFRLVSMVAGSAFMFHLTNSLFKNSMPGLDDILKQNPELMKNVQMAAMQSMGNNPNVKNDPVMSSMLNGFSDMQRNKNSSRPQKQMTQSNIPLPPVNTGQLFRNPVVPPQVDTKSAPTMRGPSGVDDILNSLYDSNSGNTKNVSVPQQTTAQKPKKRRGRPRKQTNSISIDA